MPQVTLQEILDAKEARVLRRTRIQAEYPGVCLSLSLNIPGLIKDSTEIRALFGHAEREIYAAFSVKAAYSVLENTGPHAVFAIAETSQTAKEIALNLEMSTVYGRLLDLDVYDAAGAATASGQRKQGRACFVCDDQATTCMRKNRHSPLEVAAAVARMFAAFHAAMSRHISPLAAHYASIGLEGMLHEAAACPSPGLVDPLHNGSHQDMDFFTFQRSSAALAYGLARCAEAGLNHDGAPAALLPVLRLIGLDAENSMLRATHGVNTQKGLLFSMGLTLGAVGMAARNGAPPRPETVCSLLRTMTAGLVDRELGAANSSPRTAGEIFYKKFGLTGIRGEMEAGLPSVLQTGLPTLENALSEGMGCNRALVRSLIALMAVVEDTTILARSPRLESLRQVQDMARELLASGALDNDKWQDAVWRLDAELVRRNLSPGGSADLLALTWFMHNLTRDAQAGI